MLSFVVDTNTLFTFFWKDFVTRNLIIEKNFRLFAPEYALEEINKYSSEIRKKSGISRKEFNGEREKIAKVVEFIPLEEYKGYLKNASRIQDKKDTDFIALALKLNIPIWSNDKILKEQNLVMVFSTEEVIKLLA